MKNSNKSTTSMNTTVDAKKIKINKEQFSTWLNTAVPFSVWKWSNKKHVIEAREYISKKIGEKYRNSKDEIKDRDMLLVFLLNLWVGFCTGCPIRISLNSNRYSKNGVYSRDYFSYRRTKRILKALEQKNYLQCAKGYFTDEDKKETRIWGTVKLMKLFVEDFKFKPIGDVITLKQNSLIQLREEHKKKIKNKKTGKTKTIKYSVPIDFDDTESTLLMRENLVDYNTLTKEQVITVKLLKQDLISPVKLINEILRGLVSGSIKLINSELLYKEPVEYKYIDNNLLNSCSVGSPVLSVFTNIPGLSITSVSYNKYSYPSILHKDDTIELINLGQLLTSITNNLQSQHWQSIQPNEALFLYLFYIKKLLNLLKFPGRNKKIRDKKRKRLFQQQQPLIDFGIKSLEFEINKKYLHRVFNRGSQKFDMGGRFYGSFYHGMSKNMRDRILINGNKTREIDYSALHPRMLYNKLGLEYEGDPYQIGDDSLRSEYKLVSLISINSKKQGAHIAVRDALEDAGFDIADDLDEVQTLMRNYQAHHTPIQEFLFSGVGIELQNTDSIIMEKILMRLQGHGIVGLCVHDSVIVEEEHAELLEKLMKEAYEEIMGFEPVVK